MIEGVCDVPRCNRSADDGVDYLSYVVCNRCWNKYNAEHLPPWTLRVKLNLSIRDSQLGDVSGEKPSPKIGKTKIEKGKLLRFLKRRGE